MTTRCMEKVALDVMDLRSKEGYVLVGIDYFLRFVVAEIIKEKSAGQIKKALKNWFGYGGIPEEIITDNGREFSNEMITEYLKNIGIDAVKRSQRSSVKRSG